MNGYVLVTHSVNFLNNAYKGCRFLNWSTDKDIEVKGSVCAHVFTQLRVSRSK
jgi:hypothetical protein